MKLRQVLSAAILLAQSASAATLGEVLKGHGSTQKLHGILEKLDLLEEFNAVHQATFLAMTDTAIEKLAGGCVGLHLEAIDPEVARGFLRYHLLEGAVSSVDLARCSETVVPHSVLRPPTLTNVTDGPVVKLWVSKKEDAAMYAESGLLERVEIVDQDIQYDNGVIHTIDSYLVIPRNLTETTNTGAHKGLRGLMERSGTLELIESLSDVTVLIPSHDAVKRVFPEEDFGSIEPERVAEIVKNHVVPNEVLYHDSFIRGKVSKYKTLSGIPIWLGREKSGHAFVNGHIRILQEDVLIYGGVAHIIDDVLLGPPSRIMRIRFLFFKIGHVCHSKVAELTRAATELVKAVDWWTVLKTFAYTAVAIALIVIAAMRLLSWTRGAWWAARSSADLTPSEDEVEKTLVTMGLLRESDLLDCRRVSDRDEEMGSGRGN